MAYSQAVLFVVVFGSSLIISHATEEGNDTTVNGNNTGSDNNTVTVPSVSPSWTISHSFIELSTTANILSKNDSSSSDNNSSNSETSLTSSNETNFNISTEYPAVNNTNATTAWPVTPSSDSLNNAGSGGGQRFDLASFIGGIILAVGVLGLSIFLFKVYQSRRSEYSNI